MRSRAKSIGKDTVIAALEAELQELQALVPRLESRVRLTERIAEIAARSQGLERQAALLMQQLNQARQLAQSALTMRLDHEKASPDSNREQAAQAAMPDLEQKVGRRGSIPLYRDPIEHSGLRFAHHDGGLEDSANKLDANLSAADLVICQAGCNSHHAYWRVKDYCKRAGKGCVFVDNPSATSLARNLVAIEAAEPNPM